MPYIDDKRRVELGEGEPPESSGDLNYLISNMFNRYLIREGLTYSTINELVGVLECAKLELYRRVAALYEDKKCATNGDVYTV